MSTALLGEMSHLWVKKNTQVTGVAQVSLELHFMPVCCFPGTSSVQPSHEHLAWAAHPDSGRQSNLWAWVMCLHILYFLEKTDQEQLNLWNSEYQLSHHFLWLYTSKEYQEGPQQSHQDTVQLGVLVTSHIYSFCLAVASSSRRGGLLSGQFHFSDGTLKNWGGF